MTRIDRDIVRFGEATFGPGGRIYTKRCGTIRVDTVILKPQGEKVPDTLKVYWGNEIDIFVHDLRF